MKNSKLFIKLRFSNYAVKNLRDMLFEQPFATIFGTTLNLHTKKSRHWYDNQSNRERK